MKAIKTPRRLLATAALFTLLAGAASADAANPATAQRSVAPPKIVMAQPVTFLIGTASLEEYRQSDPASRTEITRASLAQRPAERNPRGTAKAQS